MSLSPKYVMRFARLVRCSSIDLSALQSIGDFDSRLGSTANVCSCAKLNVVRSGSWFAFTCLLKSATWVSPKPRPRRVYLSANSSCCAILAAKCGQYLDGLGESKSAHTFPKSGPSAQHSAQKSEHHCDDPCASLYGPCRSYWRASVLWTASRATSRLENAWPFET